MPDPLLIAARAVDFAALAQPPHLAYDLQGSPPKIPPNATLKFDIELLDIVPKGSE